VLIGLVIVALAGAAAAAWWQYRPARPAKEFALYGNVDLRQVLPAFNNSERIAEVLPREGDRVRRGQVLARLDTSRLAPMLAQAEAQAEAQRRVVERLYNGSRPEEIAQARAQVESAKADLTNAQQRYERAQSAAKIGGASRDEIDAAKAALDVAKARLAVAEKALELVIAGPRKEEVAEAEARLRAAEAQVALVRRQLADAELVAPAEAVVRSRLMEPGEMASPQRPVFSLALVELKWVRAYVAEPDLGRVRPGMATSVAVDSFPDRRFDGWIGFISPVAEFTPKPVQTEELRTSLVYEVRVFVTDPSDELRLGMPATVYLLPDRSAEGAK
jgi:HlyD family secretion protein